MEFDSPPAGLPNADSDPLSQDLDGWNWGAFLVPTFWSSYYQIWPAVIAVALPLPFIWPLDLIGWTVELVVQAVVGIYLGMKGSGLAWRKWRGRRWSNFDDFWAAQRRWAWGGLAATIGFVVLGIVSAAIVKSPEQKARETHRFHAHGISFEYPGSIEHSDPDDLVIPTDPPRHPLWVEPFTLDDYDIVALTAETVPFVIDEGNIGSWAELLSESTPNALVERYHPAEIGGLPAAEARVALESEDGQEVTNWTSVILAGTTAITLDCQYTEENREDTLRACRRVRDTIALDPAFDKRLNWQTLDEPRSHLKVDIPPSWEKRAAPEGFELRAELEGIDLLLGSEPFVGSLREYTDFGLRELRGAGRAAVDVVSREETTIGAGPAEVTHVRTSTADGPLNLVLYTLVKGTQGYFLIAPSSDDDLPFMKATAAAIAETLEVKR